jgi:hypothetical protein
MVQHELARELWLIPKVYDIVFIHVKLSKKSRNKRRSNLFYGVLCEVSSCTVTVYYHSSTWIRYQNNYVLVSDRR